MKYYLIYKITNLLNQKIYIGKHETVNLNDGYMGSGNLIKKAIHKYGIENFKKDILYYCSSRSEMDQREAEIVTEDFCKRKDTYNINTGGSGGWYYVNQNNLHGDGKRGGEVISSKMKDLVWKEKFCRKVKESMTQEVRKKISEKVKNHIKENGSCWTGKHHTEDTKNKMRNTFRSHNHQQGLKNSQYGHIWVYNEELKINKSIRKEDLQKYVDCGYRKGRKIIFNTSKS